jgi:peptidoglycan/LPS O-acetylase OafA/YrhL
MSNSSRSVARLLLALGYGGGVVLLLLLLTKDDADALTARVGYTALSLIVLGLVAAAGARLLYREDPISIWGWTTALIAVVTFVLVVVEVWSEDLFFGDTRVWAMLVISALFGGGSLVLGGEEDDGNPAIRAARSVALLALVALGVLTVMIASGVDVGPRWFGVASTVFLVSALSLPLLRAATDEPDRAF